ncbi:MAG: hypothetical protein A2147_02665 [Chloroflexi bacterium RBG_16_57_8]|nr:MAG: hypothetical protein A2147_02665 [Chloroflexi bacterium RBG_16_57_8]
MDHRLTEVIRKRYDRGARRYDLMEALPERWRFAKWRSRQWSKVAGRKILEVGVGTGKNLTYYPAGSDVTAIDFSEQMLLRAKKKAARLGTKVRLTQMDVQKLQFPDNTFDAVAATFVFCSVPDPVLGLREVERVCKPGGRVVLLEHVLSANRVLAWLMNAANPVMVRMTGANMNRRTVENVAASGLVIERVTHLGIVKLIEAKKRSNAGK